MSQELSVRDFRFMYESSQTDRLIRRYYRLAFKALKINAFKSKEAFLFTMRFFYQHPMNLEAYVDVMDDTLMDLETEELSQDDVSNIQTIIKGLGWIYSQDQVLYKKIRSTFLELVTETFVKNKQSFSKSVIHHEPEVMIRRKPFFDRSSNWNQSRIDVVALNYRKKQLILAECKANLNGFFGILDLGMRFPERLNAQRKNAFRRGRNKVAYLGKFEERCQELKIASEVSSVMTTFLDSRVSFRFPNLLDNGKIKLLFAEDIANELFERVG
ncbi:hypothetical protein [Levilactobacillus suantsaiihabitans]|uniref:Uncharacterized protein n=1 Tax=Levilactobacillus suantsaiihabitans TaxID=2487722 RepID=A0A4Z0J699_9LACO|nr:hypothetical protein [Levilactobacillus suantsaiihabitans]TGD18042.1 hypothetical protein EGT51_10185 [Levilactobacillus suantsaiihabitans]